jgi:F-type H+-transporting ATPase subunit epsilon
MSMTIRVELVSAEATIYSGKAELVVIPALLGEMGIAPRHAPLLTALKPGCIRVVVSSEKEEIFYINGGLAEVQPHLVTILGDVALRASDLDEAAALEVKKRAELALSYHQADFDYSHALAELAQAIAQLRAIEQLRKKMLIK